MGITLGDFDSINGLDAAISLADDNTLMPLLNAGNGTLQPGTPVASIGTQVISAVDITADGVLDLVTGSAHGMGLAVGNGDGTFQPIIPYIAGSATQQGAQAVADMNGDGRYDVVSVDGDLSNVLVLINNGCN